MYLELFQNFFGEVSMFSDRIYQTQKYIKSLDKSDQLYLFCFVFERFPYFLSELFSKTLYYEKGLISSNQH